MKSKIGLLCIWLLALGNVFLGHAQQKISVRFRVDIGNPESKVKLKHVSFGPNTKGQVYPAHWMNEKKDFVLCYEFDARDEWQEVTFTFVGDNDGIIPLFFKGNWHRLQENAEPLALRVLVDNISVNGSVLNNGDFEELNDKGFPRGWQLWAKDDKAKSAMVAPKEEGDAQSGNIAIRVWHNEPVVQRIEIQKDQPITIRVWYKRAKLQPKDIKIE